MFCSNCNKTVMEGSRFCMYCGFQLCLGERDEKTKIDSLGVTICESNEDFSEKTRVISQEPSFSKRHKKPIHAEVKPPFFAWLVCLEGPNKGRDYRILKEKTSIGKSDDNDIVIKNDYISRNHAVIFHEGNRFILNDLQSTNNTFVNDKKISRKVLRDNDVVKFGQSAYLFKCL